MIAAPKCAPDSLDQNLKIWSSLYMNHVGEAQKVNFILVVRRGRNHLHLIPATVTQPQGAARSGRRAL